MRIILVRDLPDGRRVIVYDRGIRPHNLIAVIKHKDSSVPERSISMRGDEERWKDKLAKELKMSKKELGIE